MFLKSKYYRHRDDVHYCSFGTTNGVYNCRKLSFLEKLKKYLDIINLTVSSYHVRYAFWSESTLYSCLNVKELLARNRRSIWSSSGLNGIRNHSHLVCKLTLNHVAIVNKKTPNQPVWLNGRVFVYELSGCGFEFHCCYKFSCCRQYKRYWKSYLEKKK